MMTSTRISAGIAQFGSARNGNWLGKPTSEAIHGAAHPGRVRDEAAEEAGEPDETAAAAGGDAAEGVAEDVAEATGKDAPEPAAGEEQ